jgi:hypothetical protein
MRTQLGNFEAALRGGIAMLTLLVATACGGNDPLPSLTVILPEDGGITEADDLDANPSNGIQVRVVVEATGLDDGEVVTLNIEGQDPDTRFVSDGTLVGDAVQITFEVTLFPDPLANPRARVQATARSEALRSDIREYQYLGSSDCQFPQVTAGMGFPAPVDDNYVFTADQDTDGIECGLTYTFPDLTFEVPAGATGRVNLLLDGSPEGSAEIVGNTVTFSGVRANNTTPVGSLVVLEFEADLPGCGATLPGAGRIIVDGCPGPVCRIDSPPGPFLSSADNRLAPPAYGIEVVVATDNSTNGQPFRLFIDGVEVGSANASGGQAVFGPSIATIAAEDGDDVTVGVICRDMGGAETLDERTYTVDRQPCAIAITSPAPGTTFRSADSPIRVTGTTMGEGCTSVEIAGTTLTTGLESWQALVALGSSATQTLTATVTDRAGNTAEASIDINVDTTGAPLLQIVTPAEGAAFNVDGTGGRTADLNPGTTTCEALVEVRCTEAGEEVVLFQGTDTEIARATCEARTGLPDPFVGVATFAEAPIPSVEDGSAFDLTATQTADGVTGRSDALSIRSDCAPPILAFPGPPVCDGTELITPDRDTDEMTPGLQFETCVTTTDDADVSLTVVNEAGTVVSSAGPANPVGGQVCFPDATFPGGGILTIQANSTDAANNPAALTACPVIVGELPNVTILQPTADQNLGPSNDCGGGPGFDLRVRGTSDAAPGSRVTVTLDGVTIAMGSINTGSPNNTFNFCVPASDVRDGLLEVLVVDEGVPGSASFDITIDTTAPTSAIGPITTEAFSRRGGSVDFDFSAVADTDGAALASYEVRCDADPITSEAEWDDAMVMDLATPVVPGSVGTAESLRVEGFRVAVDLTCVVRGVDDGGLLTPLPGAGVDVALEFEEITITSGIVGSTDFGRHAAAVGDVNGDGIDDFLVSSTVPDPTFVSENNRAYLFFGGATGPALTPDVTFEGFVDTTTFGGAFDFRTYLGADVAGIGDFNDDGRNDFAIGMPFGNGVRGTVWVFYGQPSTFTWPATITQTSSTACPPEVDLCILSDDAAALGDDESAFLGWSVAAAGDFDDDGVDDLVISGPGNDFANDGQIYVLLGGNGYTSGTTQNVPDASGMEPDCFHITSTTSTPFLGFSVASAGGSVDGDAFADILFTVSGRSAGSVVRSRGYVVDGRAHTVAGLIDIPSTDWTELLDRSPVTGIITAAPLGDVNGDDDLESGFWGAESAGTVQVFDGSTTGLSAGTSFLRRRQDTNAVNWGNPASGEHPILGTLGDLDGDGTAEMLVGSDAGTPSSLPVADGFYGGADIRTPIARPADFRFTGTPGGRLRVEFVGDVDGDGFNDFLVMDPDAAGGGSVRVLY